MTIIEKRDVKNHLSLRHSKDIFLCESASQPDATGYSLAEPDAVSAKSSEFAKDYCADHTIAVTPAAAAVSLIDSKGPRQPSKSARA